MNLAVGAFVNVSGVDRNAAARTVYVWCRDKGPEDYVLRGSGRVVGAVGRPPGISIGQFSVTVLLPPGCSPADVFVTDDKNGDARLTDITVTPCSGVAGVQPGNVVSPSDPASASPPEVSPQPSQIMMAHKRS